MTTETWVPPASRHAATSAVSTAMLAPLNAMRLGGVTRGSARPLPDRSTFCGRLQDCQITEWSCTHSPIRTSGWKRADVRRAGTVLDGPTERSTMPEAYIVDTVRTPVGKRGGSLSQLHPADLAAISLNALIERTTIDPAGVEDVIMGCLDTIGPQAGDIARTSWLAAGLPETTPGVTIDRQCGSSQQAVHFAAQAVLAGVSDLVVAAGVQNMSMIPIGSAQMASEGKGLPDILAGSEGWLKRYGDQEISQFRGADMIAEQWGISRDDMEAFAVESHERAIKATREGRFENEIFPVNGLAADEGPREPNWEKIRSLQDPTRGRPHHRCDLVADLRRVSGDAHCQRGRFEGTWPHATRSYPPSLGAR